MPTVELRVVSGSQSGALLPLAEGKFLIGREHDCHLRPNSELVSRHHCAFTRDAFSVRLRDLGSTNGTFVNGERIRGTAVLKPGDRVAVGKLEVELVVDGQPGASAEETLHAQRDDTIVVGKPAQPVPQGDSGFDVSTMSDALSQLQDETAAVAAAPPPTTSGTVVIPAPESQELAAAAAVGAPPGMPAYPQNPWTGQPQYPYPGMYPQYPGMPYGYGYPYPNMPQMPPGYGYPQAMPQQPMPVQPAPETEPEQKSAEAFPEFNLPDPKTTGAKSPDAPAPPKPGDPSKPKAHIPSAAQDIINSYLNRRPKT